MNKIFFSFLFTLIIFIYSSTFDITSRGRRVEDFKLAEVPEAKYGQFYGGDSYVLLYSYQKNRRDEYIIYFWQV